MTRDELYRAFEAQTYDFRDRCLVPMWKAFFEKQHFTRESWKNYYRRYAILTKDAKSRKLSKEDAAEFAQTRNRFNEELGVSNEEIRKYAKCLYDEKGKRVRCPAKYLAACLEPWFRRVKHGRNYRTGTHFLQKWMPTDKGLDLIFAEKPVETPVETPKPVEKPADPDWEWFSEMRRRGYSSLTNAADRSRFRELRTKYWPRTP